MIDSILLDTEWAVRIPVAILPAAFVYVAAFALAVGARAMPRDSRRVLEDELSAHADVHWRVVNTRDYEIIENAKRV